MVRYPRSRALDSESCSRALRSVSADASRGKRAYHEHGAEVAHVGEELLHGRLLGVDGEVLQHVLVQGAHAVVHDQQLLVLLTGQQGKAVSGRVKGVPQFTREGIQASPSITTPRLKPTRVSPAYLRPTSTQRSVHKGRGE